LFMQAGFLLLEGGRVRSKNSINVAQKNVADLMVSWVAFFLVGFVIMYSMPVPDGGESRPSPLHFLFQLGFCATAASIVSGGVAERMRFVPYLIVAAVMGGLVTSTASIHVMQANEAMQIGLLGGSLATWTAQYLLERWKLDDPVDVVATHGVAGIFGTLLFALVAPVEMLVGQYRVMQFGIQLLGCAVVVTLAGGVIFFTLKLVERFTPLRVTAEEELIGLNASEHGDSVGADRLNRALYEKVSADEQFGGAINLAEGDEHNDTVSMINQLIQRQEEARAAIAASEQKFQQFANTASDWLWETDRHLKFTVLHIVTEELEPLNNAQWQGKLLHEVVDTRCFPRIRDSATLQ
jgi:PAS domain-containing protein